MIPSNIQSWYRRLISDFVHEVDGKTYQDKSAQLHLQDYWTKWCDSVKKSPLLNNMAGNAFLFDFILPRCNFDTLPGPHNLKQWSLINE